MATFLTDLFNSIFTPGPTPTLLVATNVSFACLQAVLLFLLIATYNAHFFALSILSAGLWWAINWFVTELNAVQAEEATKKKRDELQGKGGSPPAESNDRDSEAETVVETGVIGSKEVEVIAPQGELKARGSPRGGGGNKSEASTEDEWEKVSEENETEKDK